MKEYQFENFREFCEQVRKSLKNLEIEKFAYSYFFVDVNKKEIIKANGTHFLEFYLRVLKRMGCYTYDDCKCYLFIGNKNIFIKNLKERKIYKEQLGYNYDSYDMVNTDNVFQLIKPSNIKIWLDKFTINRNRV